MPIVAIDLSARNVLRVVNERLQKAPQSNPYVQRAQSWLNNQEIVSALKSNFAEHSSGLSKETINRLSLEMIGNDTNHFFNITKISASSKSTEQFTTTVKQLLTQETGFQSIFSAYIVSLINHVEDIALNPRMTSITFYQCSRRGDEAYMREDHSIKLFFEDPYSSNDLFDNDDLLQSFEHELNHASHFQLGLNFMNHKFTQSRANYIDSDLLPIQAFINFSILNSNDVFAMEFYPEMMKKGKYVTEPSQAWQRGFGSLTHKNPHQNGDYVYYYQLENDWSNYEEMLCMRGYFPIKIKNTIFIIEDRQNECVSISRYNPVASDSSKPKFEPYRTHYEDVHATEEDEGAPLPPQRFYPETESNKYRNMHDPDFTNQTLRDLNQERIPIQVSDNGKKAIVPKTKLVLSKEDFELGNQIEEIDFEEGSEMAYIPDNVLSRCKHLTKITLPPNLQRLKKDMFSGCSCLETVECGNNSKLQVIEGGCFQGSLLKEFKVPKNVKTIGWSAFENCAALKKVEFEQGSQLKIIGDCCFKNSSLQEIVFPANLESINKSAFEDCAALEKVEFEQDSQLKTIYDFCFKNSNLQEIVFPANLKSIKKGAFENCSNLTKYSTETNSCLLEIANDCFKGCDQLIYCDEEDEYEEDE